ncbi:MAG: tRNA (adenosine(37)-N6)-dimethylallyltransferase MiaA, partial [Deltaproteobacteria bacterium]
QEQAEVPHHLLGILDPAEQVDAAWYVEQARAAAKEIEQRGGRVFFVGGAPFYLRALRFGLFTLPAVDPERRRALIEEAAHLGTTVLHERLRRIDPQRAAEIHPNDRYRIVRALEIHATSGLPPSELYARHRASPPPSWPRLVIGLDRPRDELYRRIDERVERMIEGGLVAEVAGLLSGGLSPEAPGLRALGYRQIVAHLRGECSLSEAVASIQRETRRFAKRQLTWFRKDPEIVWFHPEAVDAIEGAVASFLGQPLASPTRQEERRGRGKEAG